MRLRRWRIITLAVVLGIVGAALPVAVMAWLSWRVAEERELGILDVLARKVVNRAELTFAESYYAMDVLQKSGLVPCSNDHIARMRTETINVLSIEEIGYFENGFLKCTSWGPAPAGIAPPKVDYTGRNGLKVSLRIKPAVSLGQRMTALQMGSYNVLVVPLRFVDVFIDNGIAITLMNDTGKVINTRNDPDLELAATLARDERQRGLDEGQLYTVLKRNGLVVVATESKAIMTAEFLRQMKIFVPFGGFMALFIIGIVYWMSRERLSPKAELDLAIRNREFIVHYQPIVELETGICFGAEALVRWLRPDGTLVRPDLFIPIAEETGLIMPITNQVVEIVIAELKSLLVNERTLHIAINLCAEDITTGRILDFLDGKLQSTGIHREQIWLEITERGLVDIDAARVTLRRARQAGHAVAIDDFGTGYSSLQYLQGLPIDALKIDKSFVDTIGKDSATSSVILHIITMSQELGLLSTAEGVETEDQAAFLRARGVNFAQGWLFSRPLPAKEFIGFHKNNKETFGAAREIVTSADLEPTLAKPMHPYAGKTT
ncbi:sensor c-di-GMP phosphodiesterase-like protein [Pararhizobium capsulatum DSM 1112]|uniref:cyclic-guanylate-specific phosphodiesterase n=1 Tax=Pararhizobium capsulatum DSM 1112 TaxID=1121113 RepID=A0ABU0BX27_9HYPH|nr:EAL domain-containing protein [Pararhizobium capsulatum]MDQ0322804.1 sensor c-di-GMP phosphodiesterase-like protein [Pararhizobium capsulatum DSM 1112]